MKPLLLWGQTRIQGHWTLLPALALLLITEGPTWVLLGLLALLLHEAGHLLTARCLGFRVEAVELWPFGAAMVTDAGSGGWGEGLVALAGPVCGLGAAGMCLLLREPLPMAGPVLDRFCRMNLSLALFNLLPAWPLDGGRAGESLLRRKMPRRRAHALLCGAGVALGTIGLGLLLYGALLGIGREAAFVPAVFLLLAGIRGLTGEEQAVASLLEHERALRAGRPLPLRTAAVSARLTAGEALTVLRRGSYTQLQVMNRAGEPLGVLSENALLNALLRQGSEVVLEELIGRGFPV